MTKTTRKPMTKPQPRPLPNTITQALSRACMLDRLADMELQHGHHIRAEHLARRAAEMRGGNFMSAETSSAEIILNAALYAAVVETLSAEYEFQGATESPAKLAQHVEDRAQVAALEVLAALIEHGTLRQTIARAFAAEAGRLARENAN